MVISEHEKEILREVRFSNLKTSIGEQISTAMGKLWTLNCGKKPPENHFLFDFAYWQRIITLARTKWIHPTDSDEHCNTPYDHAIKKIRKEGYCLTKRGGRCHNPCPNPDYKICGPALHLVTEDIID